MQVASISHKLSANNFALAKKFNGDDEISAMIRVLGANSAPALVLEIFKDELPGQAKSPGTFFRGLVGALSISPNAQKFPLLLFRLCVASQSQYSNAWKMVLAQLYHHEIKAAFKKAFTRIPGVVAMLAQTDPTYDFSRLMPGDTLDALKKDLVARKSIALKFWEVRHRCFNVSINLRRTSRSTHLFCRCSKLSLLPCPPSSKPSRQQSRSFNETF